MKLNKKNISKKIKEERNSQQIGMKWELLQCIEEYFRHELDFVEYGFIKYVTKQTQSSPRSRNEWNSSMKEDTRATRATIPSVLFICSLQVTFIDTTLKFLLLNFR